jgi:hypothetical protein
MSARLSRTALVLGAIAGLTLVTAVGAALVIFASPDASAPTVAICVPDEMRGPRAPAGWPRARIAPSPADTSPQAASALWIRHDGRGVLLAERHGSGVEINKVGSILLVVGLVGVVPAMLFLLWSSRPRRDYSF